MPLRAILNGEELIAPFIDDVRWDALKHSPSKSDIMLPCCGAKGYLRQSKLGTKHFVHDTRAECSWKPETWQHLKAKSDIVVACRNAGYDVSTEVSGEGWRADVLATKGTAKVAFEVQWSTQTLEETQARQERYQQSGIRGCWFFKKVPYHEPSRELPLFPLAFTADNTEEVELARKTYALGEFVDALLSRRIRFCPIVTSSQHQLAHIVFFEMKCWRCGKPSHVYYVNSPVSDCGIEFYNDGLWNNAPYRFAPEILAAVQGILASDAGKMLRVGKIKRRYSNTVEHSYMSFGCHACDAILGDHYVMIASFDPRNDESTASAIFEKEIVVQRVTMDESVPHWCFPTHGEFCC